MVPSLALNYLRKDYQFQFIYESVHNYLCICTYMRNKYLCKSEFVWNVNIQNIDTKGYAKPWVPLGRGWAWQLSCFERSALVNIRRKALSPLMIFTQGRTVSCFYISLWKCKSLQFKSKNDGLGEGRWSVSQQPKLIQKIQTVSELFPKLKEYQEQQKTWPYLRNICKTKQPSLFLNLPRNKHKWRLEVDVSRGKHIFKVWNIFNE